MRPTYHSLHPFAAWLAAIICLCHAGQLRADNDPQQRSLELFEKHVRPTLVEACIRCHGPEKQQGGLRLDSSSWMAKGGDSGEVVDTAYPDESILLTAIRYDDPSLEMPPKGKLPDATIRAFESWIRSGAHDPREDAGDESDTDAKVPSVADGRSFWAFQPITSPPPPAVKDHRSGLTTIDRFVQAELESAEITHVPEADRTTLIRRVFYDLIGLPPSPEQILEFENDTSQDAYQKLIDRLLHSPRFGERWGRHWLDVVRFAQSSGGGRTLLFPDAWRYRDFVIDAFNDDMPYDQFVTEQIAGDLLQFDDWKTRRRQLTATSFLLLGPTNYEKQDKDELEMDVVDEQIDTIGKSMLGMTIGCARCHDHKFDPIPTEDYYGLAGILKSTKAMIHDNVSTWNKVALPTSPEMEEQIRKRESRIAELKKRLTAAKAELKRFGGNPETKKRKLTKKITSSAIEGIVVDDTQAEIVGQWTPSTVAPRYVDEGYIHDGTADKGSKRVIYRPEIKVAGSYEVRVGYSSSANRSSNVPIHLRHDHGTTVVRINQKMTPEYEEAFVSVGVYSFSAGSDAEIVISTEGTDDGVVIADAIVLVPSHLAPLPTPDQVDIPENIAFVVQDPKRLDGIVVDDTEAELIGDWHSSVHTPPFVGASYLHDQKESKGKKSAKFTPTLPHDGTYEVRIAHNTNVRRAANVPITVLHANGSTRITIDQNEPAPIERLFRSIGEFRFKKGQSGSVTIETEGTDGKYVIVDAVQFIPNLDQSKTAADQREIAKAAIDTIEKELKRLQRDGPSREYAMATADDDDAGDIPIAIRGVVHNPGKITPRGLLQVAATNPRPVIADGQSGRMELADWIASADNPLTARVMANRVWHWLFGRGLVASVDNFGAMGDRPTHPELLDYLATSFIDSGWSTKQLIRQIMLSRVYRQSTAGSASGFQNDSQNRLLWRMNRKRLDAEQIRDTLLVVAESLDETAGGPNIKPGTSSEYGYVFDSERRSVYLPVFRNTLPEIFEVFDFADPNIQQGSRSSSTISSQALLLMNHPFVIEQTRSAAKQMLDVGSSSVRSRIETAYLRMLGRPPTTAEATIAVEFLGDLTDDEQAQHRWGMLYQTLVQSVDFRYVN